MLNGSAHSKELCDKFLMVCWMAFVVVGITKKGDANGNKNFV